MTNKNMNESKLKQVIRNYLSNAELKETLHDPKLDLGFRFVFPKGTNPQGKPIGRPFTVIKVKNKNILEITSPVPLSPEHIKKLGSTEKQAKNKFVRNLVKQFVLKEVFFQFDLSHNRYAVIDNIFLDKNRVISRNTFYNSVRKVLGCVIYSILELQDFCSGDFDIGDLRLIS